jgi:poly(ADP-ribose) glycohydrolase ARH3
VTSWPAPSDPAADRSVGALLGTALGDAVGAPFEGHRRPPLTAIDEHLAASSPLRWTDDTHMALALADSLLATDGTVDPQHLGDTFARRYAEEPWRGYGSGPPQVFALARQGTTYEEAAGSLFGGAGSFGNGAAMRCAPVAIVGSPDLGTTVALARAQARITHTHPEGIDGAVLLAGALCLLLDAGGTSAPQLLTRVEDHLTTAAFRARSEHLRTAAATGALTRDVVAALGSGVAAIESVPAALAVFLEDPADPVGVLRRAVALGGDTDTVAAMAGALVGAHLGAAAFPAALVDRLEARARIERTAQQLASLRPLPPTDGAGDPS